VGNQGIITDERGDRVRCGVGAVAQGGRLDHYPGELASTEQPRVKAVQPGAIGVVPSLGEDHHVLTLAYTVTEPRDENARLIGAAGNEQSAQGLCHPADQGPSLDIRLGQKVDPCPGAQHRNV